MLQPFKNVAQYSSHLVTRDASPLQCRLVTSPGIILGQQLPSQKGTYSTSLQARGVQAPLKTYPAPALLSSDRLLSCPLATMSPGLPPTTTSPKFLAMMNSTATSGGRSCSGPRRRSSRPPQPAPAGC